jgi:phosphoglycerate dehydrogenase-like enzyme
VRILLTDTLVSPFVAEAAGASGNDHGHEWVLMPGAAEEEILRELPTADVLVGLGVTEEMAAAATKLRLVHCCGAGVDQIAFHALGPDVTVCNTFHHGRSIAEHVVMVSIMLSRRVLTADRLMRQGVWRSVAADPTVELGDTLAGRTVGVVGLGEIGTEVVRALTGLGMRARAVRRNPAAHTSVPLDLVEGMDGLDDLLAGSDIVVLTVPLTDETRGMIGARELALMDSHALLVNVARGQLVDEDALYDALSSGRIAGAGLDVWWARATDGVRGYTRPFDQLDQVVLTPHSSGHTTETFSARAQEIVANIARLDAGEPLTNVVH